LELFVELNLLFNFYENNFQLTFVLWLLQRLLMIPFKVRYTVHKLSNRSTFIMHLNS